MQADFGVVSLPKNGKAMLDSGGKRRGLELILAMNASSKQFRNDLVTFAEEAQRKQKKILTDIEISALKGHDVALIAEFFYVLRAVGLTDIARLKGYLESHNTDMQRLLEDCPAGITRIGISRDQIQKCIIKPVQIRRVLHESAHGKVRFDQQTLQSLLRPKMSKESSRMRLVLLGRTGLIGRHDVGHILYSSNDHIEDFYQAHLDRLGRIYE